MRVPSAGTNAVIGTASAMAISGTLVWGWWDYGDESRAVRMASRDPSLPPGERR
jgi:hypothetical protein